MSSHSERNKGRVTRACAIVSWILQKLGDQGRVESAFEGWCRARGISQERITLVRAGKADRAAFIRDAVGVGEPGASLAMLEIVVRDELRLERFPWLAPFLLAMFRLWVENDLNGVPRRVFSLVPDPSSPIPDGRTPTVAALSRHLEWWCRVHLAESSPETPSRILFKLKQQDPTLTSQVSLVTQGIASIEKDLRQEEAALVAVAHALLSSSN